MVVIRSDVAKNQLNAAHEYIKQDSLQNAKKVIAEIVNAIIALASNPERHLLDKYKLTNDGTYRAFELYRYRISYKISIDTIRIVRMRHTSRSPHTY